MSAMRLGKKRELSKRKEQEIRYDTWHFTGKDLAGVLAKGAMLGIAAQWLCYRSLLALPVAVLIMILYFRSSEKERIRKRRETLNSHFKEFLSNLYSSVCAGYSLENSIRSSESDMRDLFGPDDILVREIRNINHQISLKFPAEDLIHDLGIRSGSDDIRLFGEVLIVTRKSGGSMEQILRECRNTMNERLETRKEIEAIMASKRYEMKIMTVMPAGILLYIQFTFTGFTDVLYEGPAGRVIMTGALAAYLFAVWVGRKVTEIPV